MSEFLSEQELCEIYAKMWNCLDASILEPYLMDDIVYESQMVLEPHINRVGLMNYLYAKLKTIRSNLDNSRPYAELGFLGSQDGSNIKILSAEEMRPCVILAQGHKDDLKGLAILETRNGKIKRIDLCIVPHPSTATRTGHYPGIDDLSLEWPETIE